jgi:hypothetical protein
MKTFKRIQVLSALSPLLLPLASGCAVSSIPALSPSPSYLAQGSILLSRSLSNVKNTSFASDEKISKTSFDTLGFTASSMPHKSSQKAVQEVSASPRIVITDSHLSVYPLNGDAYLVLLDEESTPLLTSSKVVAKAQDFPAWHSSDEYFLRRKLPVPASFSTERYVRGAFGERALFLTPSFAIHCNKAAAKEVGGIIVRECKDLEKVFQDMALGSAVSRISHE